MKKLKRILIKLSGEMFSDREEYEVISPDYVTEVAKELVRIHKKTKELAIVVGAGNIFRGKVAEKMGSNRIQGDHMGMLATVINALALQDAINANHGKAVVMSPFHLPQMSELYAPREATKAMEDGFIVICAGGTGNPYFTTDTAAALRGIELGCDLLIKGTKVDGVYTKDPMKYADATFLPHVTFDDAIDQHLEIMDAAAFSLCRDNNLPIKVGSMEEVKNIWRLVTDDHFGSLVSNK